MRLEGYLGIFRKSQEVWAFNFDPKGVNASRKPNPGTVCPPACDRVNSESNGYLNQCGLNFSAVTLSICAHDRRKY